MDKLNQLNPLALEIKVSEELPKSAPTATLEQMRASRAAAIKLLYEKPPLRQQPVRTLGEAEMRTYTVPPPVIRVVPIRVKRGPGKRSKRTILTKSYLLPAAIKRILSF